MYNFTSCRRTFVAIIGLLGLFALGALKGMDVGMPIAAICMGLAGANAYERSETSKSGAAYTSPKV